MESLNRHNIEINKTPRRNVRMGKGMGACCDKCGTEMVHVSTLAVLSPRIQTKVRCPHCGNEGIHLS